VQHYFRLGILCRITTVHNFIIDYRHVENRFHNILLDVLTSISICGQTILENPLEIILTLLEYGKFE
jgi:hypothetical protein